MPGIGGRIIRSRLAKILAVILIMAAILAVSASLLMRTDFFSSRVSEVLSGYYFYGTDYVLDIGRVGGNAYGSLEIEDVVIRYEGEDFSYDILRIGRIELEYNIMEILGESHRIKSAVLTSPHVWIKPDSSGINRIPGGKGKGGGVFDFSFQDLRIRNGQLIYQTEKFAEAVKGIDLQCALSSSREGILLKLFSGSGKLITRNLDIREIKGNILVPAVEEDSGEPAGGLRLDRFNLRTANSKLAVDGIFDPGTMEMDLSVKIVPLDIEEIFAAMNSGAGHKGRLNGEFELSGRPDSLRISAMTSGVIAGYALSDMSLDLSAEGSDIALRHFSGGLNGAFIEGEGSLDLKEGLAKLGLRGEGIDLSKGFYPGKSLPKTDFNGRIDIGYSSSSGGLSFDFDLEKGHLSRIPYKSASIQILLKGDTLFAERMRLVSPTHDISANGWLAGDDLKLFLDLECSAQDTLFSYFNISDYRAGLDVTGLWQGSFDSWELRLSGRCENLGYSRAYIPAGNMKLAVEKDDSYDVYFDLIADSCRIGPFEFSGLDLSLEYMDGKVNFKKLELSREEIKADIQGEISTGGKRTRFDFGAATLSVYGDEWVSSGDFMITADDSSVVFDDLQMHSKLGALYFEGSLSRLSDELDATASFERMDLSLLNRAGLVSFPLQGKAEGAIDIAGRLDNPRLNVDLKLSEGRIDTLSLSSLEIGAGIERNHFRIDTLRLRAATGSAFARGEIFGPDAAALIRGGLDTLRYSEVDMEIKAENLTLKPFLGYIGNMPFSDGMFTGSLTLSDSLAHPSFYFDGSIEDIRFSHITIPRIDLRARKEAEDVVLDGRMFLTSSRKEGEISGRFPLRNNRWFYSLDRGKPFELAVKVPEYDIEEISGMSDLVASARGKCSVEFRAGGSVNKPDLSGSLSVEGAGFRPAGMEERFRDVDALITLRDTLLSVQKLTGREGKDGKFECSGTVSLRGWAPVGYDLVIDAEKVLLASIRDVMAIVSGRLNVGTRIVEGNAVPLLEGSVEVNEAEMYFDIGELGEESGEGVMTTPSYLADIGLDLKGSTRIRTPDANIEVIGNVTLMHDARGTYLRGTLKLHRGWYNIYNNKFRIVSGTLEFVHAGGFRPIVDIEAVTYDPEGKRIYLTIAWHGDDPQPRLSLRHEDSGYSETDIWKMLGGGIVGSSGGDVSDWDALGTAQNLAANYLERVLNSQMEGFTVSLEQNAPGSAANGMTGERETMIAIGKYLSEGLYVQFKQGLSVATEREIEIEYRISDLFLIRSEIIKHSDKVLPGQSLRSTDEINVDIKLRWEF